MQQVNGSRWATWASAGASKRFGHVRPAGGLGADCVEHETSCQTLHYDSELDELFSLYVSVGSQFQSCGSVSKS